MKNTTQFLYRDILKKAFVVTLKHPFLWVFGFFTTFLGLGSIYEVVFKNAANQSSLFGKFGAKITSISVSGWFIGENLNEFTLGNILFLLGSLLVVVAVFLFVLWLSINSFGGLIHSANLLDRKKKTTFQKGFLMGKEKFWKLLAVNVVGKILIFLLLILTGGTLSFFLLKNSITDALLYFFSFLVFIAVSLLISFLIIYASAYIMLKSKGVLESIHDGWELFKKNWVVSIEAAAILFLINILAKIALTLIIVALSVPFMLLLLLGYSMSLKFLPIILLALWIIAAVFAMIIIGSFFASFQIVAWTLLFDKISKGGVLSKLYRIFK